VRDGGGLPKLVVSYIAIGFLWSFLINVGTAVSGGPSAFVVVTGGAPIATKAVAVLGIVGRQVLLWPVELYERVISTVVG
jgi:hypothetical protein